MVTKYGGKLPTTLLIQLGEALARCLAACHSARVCMGVIDMKYVLRT